MMNATNERQKTASMDVIEYVLYLMNVVMRLKQTADAATHAMPSSACDCCIEVSCSPAAALVTTAVGSSASVSRALLLSTPGELIVIWC